MLLDNAQGYTFHPVIRNKELTLHLQSNAISIVMLAKKQAVP